MTLGRPLISPCGLPRELRVTCRRMGVRLPRDVLIVWIGSQRLDWWCRAAHAPERSRLPANQRSAIAARRATLNPAPAPGLERAGRRRSPREGRPKVSRQGRFRARAACVPGFALVRRFVISTSRFGVGQEEGSHRTPLGLHRIAQKIGGGHPIGTVFRGRKAVGLTRAGLPWAPIAHRILWLEGLEPGRNRGNGVDSFRRYIYLHGVGDELTLGRPASRGCIQLSAADLLMLYERLRPGTLVWLAPGDVPRVWPTQRVAR